MAARARGSAVVELIRLGVVVALTAAGNEIGAMLDLTGEPQLLGAVLGALVGYIVGGAVGRRLLRTVDETQERLRRVESVAVVAGAVGGLLSAALALALVAPLALLPGRMITMPIGFVVVLVTGYAGVRVGAARGGDLGRYLGVRGRIEVSSPAKGGGVKVIDSSALIDGRLLSVARIGFLDGTLVVPRFVLMELQGLADSEDRRRRNAGRRGLEAVTALQQEGHIVLEVTDDDPLDVHDVDGKLARVARDRDAALVTIDSALARIAEIGGLRVLDLNQLAESMRPPAIPGDRIEVEVMKAGREPGQGVAYLPDGTMVVVERAEALIGQTTLVEITSINQSSRGRMLFGVAAPERRQHNRSADESAGRATP